MLSKKRKKGTVILEVLIAIGLSAFFFSAIAGLMVTSNKSMESLYSSQKAIWRAQEGIGAIQSMSFNDLYLIDHGHVIYSDTKDQWSIDAGIQNFADGQSREVSISQVERDNACAIVESGGVVDPDSYKIESTVYWPGSTGIIHNRNLQSLVVNWEDPQGDCFKPTDASGIELDWSGGYWGGSKQLRGVYIINNTSRDITITKMTIWWDQPASQLQQIFAIGTKVWSDSGPGSPAGLQNSGVEIDTLDATIPAGFTDDTHKIQFTQAMNGSTLIISFEFSDGSILITDPFTP